MEYIASRSLDELFARELLRFERAYQDGNLVAVYEALVFVKDKDITPPKWVVSGAIELAEQALLKPAGGRRGRTANPRAEFRARMVDYLRWSTVVEVREQQTLYSEDLSELEELIRVKRITEAVRKLILSRIIYPGRTLEDAYRLAAEILQGTSAYGSPDTVKKSYKKLNRIIKKAENGDRPGELGQYALFSSKTLRKFLDPDTLSAFIGKPVRATRGKK